MTYCRRLWLAFTRNSKYRELELESQAISREILWLNKILAHLRLAKSSALAYELVSEIVQRGLEPDDGSDLTMLDSLMRAALILEAETGQAVVYLPAYTVLEYAMVLLKATPVNSSVGEHIAKLASFKLYCYSNLRIAKYEELQRSLNSL